MNSDNSSNNKLRKADIITSIVIFLFGLYVFCSEIYMLFYAVTGTKIWYYSPGIYPVILGIILMMLSVMLFLKNIAFHVESMDINEISGGLLIIRLIQQRFCAYLLQ